MNLTSKRRKKLYYAIFLFFCQVLCKNSRKSLTNETKSYIIVFQNEKVLTKLSFSDKGVILYLVQRGADVKPKPPAPTTTKDKDVS